MDLCPDDVAVQRLVLVHLQYHPGFGDAYCGDGKVGGGNGEAGDVAVQRLVLVHLGKPHVRIMHVQTAFCQIAF